MEITSRAAVRAQILELLLSTVEVQEVLAYQSVNISPKSPVINITSAGSLRKDFQRAGCTTTALFVIHVFVLHSDDATWTSQMAEDKIDEIEVSIARALVNFQNTALWYSIQYEGYSAVERVALSGTPYLYEAITIAVEVK